MNIYLKYLITMSATELGRKFGKPDIERIGIFSEMSYMHGKGYVPTTFLEPIKGVGFSISGRKTKDGTQVGYFEDTFKRIYIGEAIPRKVYKKPEMLTPFVINSTPKKHSTPGDNYGTFTKTMEEFSPITRPAPKFVHEPPNFLWRTGKIGGPGYADTGMDKYPAHLPDPYGFKPKEKKIPQISTEPFQVACKPAEYFDPHPFTEDRVPTAGLYLNKSPPVKGEFYGTWIPVGRPKMPGGCHAGCFTPFPSFMPCKYVSIPEADTPWFSNKNLQQPFIPIPQMIKTMPTSSILHQSVDVFMNGTNYETYVPCYVDRLLPSNKF